MQKWEYLRLKVSYNDFGKIKNVILNSKEQLREENSKDWEALHLYFNDLGLQGWELVDTTALPFVEKFYFKRPI